MTTPAAAAALEINMSNSYLSLENKIENKYAQSTSQSTEQHTTNGYPELKTGSGTLVALLPVCIYSIYLVCLGSLVGLDFLLGRWLRIYLWDFCVTGKCFYSKQKRT